MKRFVYVGIAIGMLFSISACTWGPHDQMVIDKKDSGVQFWGFYNSPSSNITIEALDWKGGDWEVIGNTTSFSSSWKAMDGTDVYYWGKSVVIPTKYWIPNQNVGADWKPSIKGHFIRHARIRARSGGINLISVRQDVSNCYFSSNSVSEFFLNCAAPKSPVARVLTEYHGECVARINELRAKGTSKVSAPANLKPLARWTDAENCADDQAKKDSEAGKYHFTSGKCGDRAQNECPGWGSAASVIEGCLDDMWNEGPGSNFQKHGHYLNMTNTGFSKVACGIHETPSGKIWAVMDFK